MSKKRQPKYFYTIKISGEVNLLTENRDKALQIVEKAIEDLDWYPSDLDVYLDITPGNKIELELDQDKKIAIDIISKAFNWTSEQFIQYAIKRDIEYVMGYAGLNNPLSSDLEQHYHLDKVDMNELKKLTLTEGIL